MNRSFRKALCVAAAGVLLTGVAVFSAGGQNSRTSYDVPSSVVKGDLKDVQYLGGGKLLLVSGTSSRFQGVLTDSSQQSSQLAWESQGGFRASVLLEDRIVLVSETAFFEGDGVIRRQVQVASYELDGVTPKGKTAVIQNLSSLPDGGFAAGQNGTYYFLKTSEPNAVYSGVAVSESGKEETYRAELLCELEEPVSHLNSIDGCVYAVSEEGTLWRLDDSGAAALSGDRTGPGLKFLSQSLAIDGDGEIYQILKENLTVKRLFSSQSAGAACAYENGVLADFGSVLLFLNEKGEAVGQSSLDKRYPQFLFAEGRAFYSVSSVNNGVRIEYADDIERDVSIEEFTQDSGAFLATPAPGSYPLLQAPETCTVALNPAVVNPGRGNACVSIVCEESGDSVIRDFDSGLELEGMNFTFRLPEPLKAGKYHIELRNLCTSEGLPAKCSYSLAFTEDSSVPSSPSSDVSSEEDPGLITSQVYAIDPETRIMTGVEPGCTLAQIKENLSYEGDLVVRSYQGTRISSGGVGTGAVFTLLRNGIEVDKVTLLIYGDVTGDGNVNEKDVVQLVEHEFYYQSRTVLKGLFLEAADVNRDGTYTFDDLDSLYKSIYDYRIF